MTLGGPSFGQGLPGLRGEQEGGPLRVRLGGHVGSLAGRGKGSVAQRALLALLQRVLACLPLGPVLLGLILLLLLAQLLLGRLAALLLLLLLLVLLLVLGLSLCLLQLVLSSRVGFGVHVGADRLGQRGLHRRTISKLQAGGRRLGAAGRAVAAMLAWLARAFVRLPCPVAQHIQQACNWFQDCNKCCTHPARQAVSPSIDAIQPCLITH